MDKGNKNKKNKQHKNRNKEAVEFVLANREMDDPNYNNPDVNKKILLQVNKDEDLTEEQKKIINSIPKIQRGIFDEEAKLKLLLKQETENNTNSNNEVNNKKGVQFNFGKTEVINYNKNGKVSEIKEDKLFNDIKSNKIDLTKIEDMEKVNEIFNKLKINAKMVEYNELGIKKDADPELLKLITNKEFVEGIDIFVPAPKDNLGDVIEDYDNDMKEENMNEEFKELEKELKSDSENEKDKKSKSKKKEEDKNNKKSEDINTSSKEENKEKNDIEITGDLEDDFVLLANGGELPIELLTEKEIKEKEEKKKENDIKLMTQRKSTGSSSYKYITPEEVEYVRKKFLEDDNDNTNKKGQKKGNFISKQEFNDAINEILKAKKGKDKNQKETIMGLKKSVLDEDEYEEYELSEEEEEIEEDKKEKEEKNEIKENKNIDNKKLKNIISFKNGKKNEKEEINEEDIDEDEEEEEDFKPNIKIEYVSKEDEPDPFDTEKEKRKRKQKNKKEMKKSKTKQYEQLKAMGELSDESFDREQLDEITHEANLIEKTKQMIEENNEGEKNDKEINQEIEKKYIFEPKIKKDITQINEKVVNLPKAVKEEKRERQYKKKENEKEEKEENENKKDNEQSMNVNHSRRDETKEEKKLRQKLVKMERKEKRAEKKKLKNAFKEEKVAQQKQIAQANKIVRYGLSIKDI